eukprot:Rmarinus@m.29143
MQCSKWCASRSRTIRTWSKCSARCDNVRRVSRASGVRRTTEGSPHTSLLQCSPPGRGVPRFPAARSLAAQPQRTWRPLTPLFLATIPTFLPALNREAKVPASVPLQGERAQRIPTRASTLLRLLPEPRPRHTSGPARP